MKIPKKIAQPKNWLKNKFLNALDTTLGRCKRHVYTCPPRQAAKINRSGIINYYINDDNEMMPLYSDSRSAII